MSIASDLDSHTAAVPHPAYSIPLSKVDRLGNQLWMKLSRKHLEASIKLAHAATRAEEIKEIYGI